MKQRYKFILAGIILAAVLGNSAARFGHASSRPPLTPAVGNLNITGNVAISSTGINFLAETGPSDDFRIGLEATGNFSGLTGTIGFIKDLPFASTPVGTPISVLQFLSFAANPSLFFDLTFVEPGSFSLAQCTLAAAAGQTCSPAGSAYNLVNHTATSSTLSFAVRGVSYQGSAATGSTPTVGVFTLQFADKNLQQVLSTLSSGGTLTTTYSASFTALFVGPSGQQRFTSHGQSLASQIALSSYRRARLGFDLGPLPYSARPAIDNLREMARPQYVSHHRLASPSPGATTYTSPIPVGSTSAVTNAAKPNAPFTAVVGNLSITGNVAISSTGINFLPETGPSDDFRIGLEATGNFAGLTGTIGFIKDLPIASTPVGTPISVLQFLSFAAFPGLFFDLTFVEPGSFSLAQCTLAAAAGQTCSPAGSAYNLVNHTATSSTLSFAVRGVSYQGSAATGSTPTVGVFTLQFADKNLQQVLSTLSSGGTLTTTYSASFTALAECINDTQPPSFTSCPTDITAVLGQGSSCVEVNYPLPTIIDNCPGATVSCSPPSGACLALGTTTVVCTATDTSNNMATCMFTVTTFDVCLQDDSNSSIVLLWNSQTGDYRFCCRGTTFTGVGTVINKGSTSTLDATASDRRLIGRRDQSVFKGTAALQMPPGRTICTITDRDTRNNSCVCQ